MTIKIQTEKTVIPIEIGKLNFEFDVSDESVQHFREKAMEVQSELNLLNTELDEEQTFTIAKSALQKGYDLMLGKGAFAKIYNQTPSLPFVMKFFEQIANGVEKELKKMGFEHTNKEKAQKYLEKVKK
ncbi:hypothetical protein [Alkalihalobacillus trypoxylicola]|uniref:Uncharacterized protein n=1 Tax=Alkalihalobacillus trypoxylicola TaxID=519424 RepID=A0A161QKF3_9BACI|nr:hypothetical protein [Alkalihalobacillus trypoxylicola]KYG30423.1 hypothetical protein AZF04_19865 [Alkalihalobacillus trypoxylicola]